MSSTAEPRTSSTAALQIEPLATAGAMQACVRLQRLAWGYADLDVVPVNELLSVARSGGIVLGAFTEEDGARRCVGFCFGLLGRDPDTGELYHASRMLAVDPAWRGRGVGRRLKRAQREHARAQGLRCMRWTFDPLQLGNAWLNLEVLGAVGVRYHRDLFGPVTSSPLHPVGTDRLEVHWSLEDEQRPDFVPARRVPLPWDANALARSDLDTLRRWRLELRSHLERALRDGLRVVGLERDPHRCEAVYVLAQSGATP